MAIASGQLFGKGLNNNSIASVKTGNYLVEEQTDFIFAVIGEELGFAGCMFLVFMISLIVYELINIASKIKRFGRQTYMCRYGGYYRFSDIYKYSGSNRTFSQYRNSAPIYKLRCKFIDEFICVPGNSS